MANFKYGSIPQMAERMSRLPLRPAEELPETYNKSSIIRRGHLMGYIPFSPDSTIITCMCFEKGGTGLSLYPSLEVADALKEIHPVRFLIPTYEYETYKLIPPDDMKRDVNEARYLLDNRRFEVIDVSEEPYKSRRLETAMKILPYMREQNPEHAYPVGEGNLQLALGILEIADFFLCMKDRGNTVVVSDQGCAGPVVTAKKIARYIGIKSNLGALVYGEAMSLDGNSVMYHARDAKKLHLMSEEPDKKIRSAFSSGGPTEEEHRKNGGDPYKCPVQIVHSMISSGDTEPEISAKMCRAGTLGCKEHKEQLVNEYRLFVERLKRR